MNKKVVAAIKVFALALFLSYYCGATMFNHTHRFDWGTVTHSHPYIPSANHTHTVGSCQVIEQLSAIVFVVSAASVLFTISASSRRFYTLTRIQFSKISKSLQLLRAPPREAIG